jgi:hypothetical protein
MAMPAWPFGKPVTDQLGLMARRVVHDDVNVEVSWHVLLDGIEEPAELLRPAPRHALVDDSPGLHVQRGEQRGCPMSFVVVGAPLGLPMAHGQQRLSAIQCLDLRFLIDAEHQGAVRWVEVKANNIANLVDEQRISRELPQAWPQSTFPSPVWNQETSSSLHMTVTQEHGAY